MSSLPFRTRIIPWYFVMFFAVIALVDGIMVTLAMRTHTGLITDHPYEKGLAYNRVIDAESSQEKLGWKSEIRLVGNQLKFVLKDANNAPLTPTEATAYFIRPTSQGHDFNVKLTGTLTTVELPEPGVWDVRIQARVGKTDYQQTARVVSQ